MQLLELVPPGLEEVSRSDGVELAVYLEQGELERMRTAFPDATVVRVRDGWEDEWKRFHVPTVVGPLWIGPPWEAPPPALEPVVIDPGRAFGTGAHDTTRLCVEFLLQLPRASLLDVGCGSGVLAIAATKLGYAPVLAVDVDEAAVEATARNAAANAARVEVWRADALADALPPADVAVANVALDVVTALGPRLGCRLAVTSGYERSARPELAGFRHRERRHAGRWAADLYERK